MPPATVLQIHNQALFDDSLSLLNTQRHLRISTAILASARYNIVHCEAAHAAKELKLRGHADATITTDAPPHQLPIVVFAVFLLPTNDS